MIHVSEETPRQPDVLRLIEALDAHSSSLYPPESNHLLGVDSLCAPDVRFFVARRSDVAIGCGALRLMDGYGRSSACTWTPPPAAWAWGARS